MLQLMFFWLKASLAAPKTTISSGQVSRGPAMAASKPFRLGVCPYAKGATGNVATEDVVYMLHGLGLDTGIDLDKLIDAGQYISDFLQRSSNSRVAKALLTKRAG